MYTNQEVIEAFLGYPSYPLPTVKKRTIYLEKSLDIYNLVLFPDKSYIINNYYIHDNIMEKIKCIPDITHTHFYTFGNDIWENDETSMSGDKNISVASQAYYDRNQQTVKLVYQKDKDRLKELEYLQACKDIPGVPRLYYHNNEYNIVQALQDLPETIADDKKLAICIYQISFLVFSLYIEYNICHTHFRYFCMHNKGQIYFVDSRLWKRGNKAIILEEIRNIAYFAEDKNPESNLARDLIFYSKKVKKYSEEMFTHGKHSQQLNVVEIFDDIYSMCNKYNPRFNIDPF
jgi:hypothetical protein